MKDWTTIRERYMRDDVAVRLGGLAANLQRVKSFCERDANRELVEGLIDESKFFIEWTASEAAIEVASELVELQVQLACWQRQWGSIWADAERRRGVAQQSSAWSERVLNLSGLLERRFSAEHVCYGYIGGGIVPSATIVREIL